MIGWVAVLLTSIYLYEMDGRTERGGHYRNRREFVKTGDAEQRRHSGVSGHGTILIRLPFLGKHVENRVYFGSCVDGVNRNPNRVRGRKCSDNDPVLTEASDAFIG